MTSHLFPPTSPGRLTEAHTVSIKPAAIQPVDIGTISKWPRHLVYHLYPVRNSVWRENIHELQQRINLFTGRRLISVALDETTESQSIVEEELRPLHAEVRFVDNDRIQGESETLLSYLHSMTDSAGLTFYAHAKGVTHRDPSVVFGVWARQMYTLLDRFDEISKRLLRHGCCGLIRSTGQPIAEGQYQWHYPGSFYWFRNDVVANRTWSATGNRRFFTEQFPSHVIRFTESTAIQPSLLYENPYHRDTWQAILTPPAPHTRAPHAPVPQATTPHAAVFRSTLSDVPALPPLQSNLPVDISIIITCGPGFDRWIDTAWTSASRQGPNVEVFVVFDSCVPPDRYRHRPHTVVQYGNVQQSRKAGMAATRGRAVLFLDADDELTPGFASAAWTQLQNATSKDPRIAGIYPDLDYVDESMTKRLHQFITPEFSEPEWQRANYIACTTLTWRHTLDVCWREIVGHDRAEDWHMWGQLIRDGWTFQKGQSLTLRCRRRTDSMLARQATATYPHRYCLHNQPLTVFVPLSGRTWAWPDLKDWLKGLPPKCRLVLCDSSGNREFGDMIRAERWHLDDVRIYSQLLDVPGLADADRRNKDYANRVSIAVAAMYNKFSQECGTELTLIIEDDVLPVRPAIDVIDTLINGLDERTVAVSGVYYSRHVDVMLAWSHTAGKNQTYIPTESLRDDGYLPIAGSGFGCILMRRSALRSAPQASPEGEWFDPWFFERLARRGLHVKLAMGIRCDHRSEPSPPAASTIQNQEGKFEPQPTWSAAETRSRMQDVIDRYGKWTAHHIHLGHGIVPIAEMPPSELAKLRRITQIVQDTLTVPLDQARILDLACLEGMYAFEFAQRGAQAVGIEGRRANIEKARFAKAAWQLDRLTLLQDDVRNLSRLRHGSFDAVLCLGILYHISAEHLSDFVLRIAEVCRHVAIFDTHISLTGHEQVKLNGQTYTGHTFREFNPGTSAEDREKASWSSLDNETSFWPDRESLISLIRAAGFTSVYECHAPEEPEKPADRVTIVALKRT